MICPSPGSFTEKLSEIDIEWKIASLPTLSKGSSPTIIDFLKKWTKYGVGIIKLVYWLKRYRADIVHTNTIFPVGGALAAKLLGLPHIWQVREILSAPYYRFVLPRDNIRKLIRRLSHKVICISRTVEKDFVLDPSDSKTVVIYNALEMDSFDTIRKEPGKNSIVIGTVGNIRELKRQHLIPELVQGMTSRSRDLAFEWHIYGRVSGGSEKYFDDLIEKIKKMGLESYCFYKGFCEKEEIYSRLDIMVHTGAYEAFGRTFIEAMAAGIPVVAFDSGAVTETVINGETGFIIEDGDSTGMMNMVTRLVEDRELRKRIGLKGKSHVANRFQHRRYVNQILEVYESVLTTLEVTQE